MCVTRHQHAFGDGSPRRQRIDHEHRNLRERLAADRVSRCRRVAEQERIVTAIEEAFSKLDAGEAGLRTVRQLLKRMREAVLAAAVTGRLVPQDPTDTPAANPRRPRRRAG